MTTWLDGSTTARAASFLERLLDMRVFNVKSPAYGAVGGGVVNDTAAINLATAACSAAGGGIVWFPADTYLANGINTYSNVHFWGHGDASIIKQVSGVADNTNLISAYGSTTNTTGNVKNVSFNNIQLLGRSTTDTFLQHVHLVQLCGASDVNFFNVSFNGFLGDGCNLGSNIAGGTSAERHNERVTFFKCRFDGINFNNRNGLTVIDGVDVLVLECRFANCTSTGMPGAIDIEPNGATYARLQDIKVILTKFDSVAGAAGVLGLNINVTQAALTTPARDFKYLYNTFTNCTNTAGPIFFRQQQTPTASTERTNLQVTGNQAYDCAGRPFEASGIRGAKFRDNIWSNFMGAYALGYNEKVMHVEVVGDTFYKIGTAGGANGNVIEIYNVDGFWIRQSYFDTNGDGVTTGRLISFSDTGAATTSQNIDVIDNYVLGYASVCSAKSGSHTTNAATNTWRGNDTTMTPVVAHFAKQANLTYSRATETGQDAAMRTALAAGKLLTDSTVP